MVQIFLGWRYLWRRRIAMLGMLAVAFCVALLIVVSSLFTGVIEAYNRFADEQWGQVVLHPHMEWGHQEELVAELEALPSVAWALPVAEEGGLLYVDKGDVRGVFLRGTDINRQVRLKIFGKGLLRQNEGGASFDLDSSAKESARAALAKRLGREINDEELPTGIIVGAGILGTPDEFTDEYNDNKLLDRVANWSRPMVVTLGRQGDEGAEKRTAQFWPIDVVDSGMHEIDTRTVYIPFDSMRKLIGRRNADGAYICRADIQVRAADGVDEAAIKRDLQQTWMRFATERLGLSQFQAAQAGIYKGREMVAEFTREIRKQLFVLQMILGFIFIVAAALIFVILIMMVVQKRKDIGIIRAVGMSRSAVASLFLWYGGWVGMLGAMAGIGLGIWATKNINSLESFLASLLGFKIWKSGVYFIREIPSEVAWSAVWWIAAAGLITAILGALLPALRAARLAPVEALRYE